MQVAENIVNQFEPITLSEMEHVKLMDRTDTKFVFSSDQFDVVMNTLLPYYRILEINAVRFNRYQTLYYDTPELALYYKHHVGKLNRYKVRHRSYLESGIGFLEIKFKNNKGRTIKTRMKQGTAPIQWQSENIHFFEQHLPFFAANLAPIIWINYKRLTLVSKTSAERVTIDLELEFKHAQIHKTVQHLIIAEVKQEKRSASAFLKVMKQHHIREGSISKYCMGVASMVNDVKTNNFKQKLRVLQTIHT
jgi:hypothetical protein